MRLTDLAWRALAVLAKDSPVVFTVAVAVEDSASRSVDAPVGVSREDFR